MMQGLLRRLRDTYAHCRHKRMINGMMQGLLRRLGFVLLREFAGRAVNVVLATTCVAVQGLLPW